VPSRKWSPPAVTPPAVEPPAGAAADPMEAPDGSHRVQWGLLEYLASFVVYMLFFGVIAAVLRSRFPIDLGLFFFFTNSELIEWVLHRIGNRLVPDSLGATFVPSFVWFTGASLLLVRWKDAAPAWLSSWLPPAASWSVVASLALGCAVLTAVSTVFVGSVLPWFGIEIRRQSRVWTLIHGVVELAVLGFLILLASLPGISAWLEGH